jgi:hypothetical protein
MENPYTVLITLAQSALQRNGITWVLGSYSII